MARRAFSLRRYRTFANFGATAPCRAQTVSHTRGRARLIDTIDLHRQHGVGRNLALFAGGRSMPRSLDSCGAILVAAGLILCSNLVASAGELLAVRFEDGALYRASTVDG